MKPTEQHRKVSRNVREFNNMRVHHTAAGVEFTIPHSYLVSVSPVGSASFHVDVTDFVVLVIRPGLDGIWLRSPYRSGERAFRKVRFYGYVDELWLRSLGVKFSAPDWATSAKSSIFSALAAILNSKADNHQFLS